jgi:hypothetical protein
MLYEEIFPMLKKYFQLTVAAVLLLLFSVTGQSTAAQVSGYVDANASANYQGMWGTGYSGGVQGCNANWQQGSGAVSISDEELEERKRIQEAKADLDKMKLEKKRADQEMEFAKRKLERVFDSDVLDFLVDVHMDLMNQCSVYKITPVNKTATTTTSQTTCSYVDANGVEVTTADASICGGKTEVPDKLNGKWVNTSGTGYCTATSQSKAGDVSSKICSDATLRPESLYQIIKRTSLRVKKHKLKSKCSKMKFVSVPTPFQMRKSVRL